MDPMDPMALETAQPSYVPRTPTQIIRLRDYVALLLHLSDLVAANNSKIAQR